MPEVTSYDKYLEHIKGMPVMQPPSIFGFHENGETVKDLKETDELFGAMLLIIGDKAMAAAATPASNSSQTQ